MKKGIIALALSSVVVLGGVAPAFATYDFAYDFYKGQASSKSVKEGDKLPTSADSGLITVFDVTNSCYRIKGKTPVVDDDC